MSSIPISNRAREIIYEGRAICTSKGSMVEWYVKIFSDGIMETRTHKDDTDLSILSLHSTSIVVKFLDAD